VGIELYAWLRPVVGVVIGACLTVAASPEELPVGGGSFAVAPESGKWLGVDRIDQTGQSGLVGLIAEVPFGSPKELRMYVALEERAHVRVGLPEEARVRRSNPDAVQAVSDGREHVLDHPGLRINPVDHATRRHGEPKLAVLRLDSMSACTWRGRAGLPGTAPPRPSEGPPAEDPPCVTDSDFLSVR
jgi:hypothetical protein